MNKAIGKDSCLLPVVQMVLLDGSHSAFEKLELRSPLIRSFKLRPVKLTFQFKRLI